MIPLDFPGTASIASCCRSLLGRRAPGPASGSEPSRGPQRSRRARRRPFWRGHIYTLLSNRIYAGQIAHKGQLYQGQHPALIDAETWSAVRDQLAANTSRHQSKSNAAEPSLLAGLLVDVRCSSRAPYYITRRQERAALSLLRLCRAGHRSRNGSRARLGRYAPSSGNVMCAPAVTLGAITGISQPIRSPRRCGALNVGGHSSDAAPCA
jgi:Recombinase